MSIKTSKDLPDRDGLETDHDHLGLPPATSVWVYQSLRKLNLMREYMTLHTTYPLHLTTVRTYTLKLPLILVLLKEVMTQG